MRCSIHKLDFDAQVSYEILRCREGIATAERIHTICQECYDDIMGCVDTLKTLEKLGY